MFNLVKREGGAGQAGEGYYSVPRKGECVFSVRLEPNSHRIKRIKIDY